jgi:uncharacterized membrane protein
MRSAIRWWYDRKLLAMQDVCVLKPTGVADFSTRTSPCVAKSRRGTFLVKSSLMLALSFIFYFLASPGGQKTRMVKDYNTPAC